MVNITSEQILEVHRVQTIPAVIILYILIGLIFLIVGLLSVRSRSKFMMIWIFSMIFSAVILAGLIFFPEIIITISGFFT